MGAVNLDDVVVTPLKQIHTEGGDVMHGIKSFDESYAGFGEAYFSWIKAGSIKGWKRHNQMTMNLIVPVGRVGFVFYMSDTTQFRTEEIGVDCYARITVPPGVWFAFKGIYEQESLILNIANIPHDPLEVERINLSDIHYDWD